MGENIKLFPKRKYKAQQGYGTAEIKMSLQSSWLQIQRSGFDSRRFQIFWEVEGLERGSLRLVSTIEALLERKSNGSGLENREYGRMDPSRWLRDTPLSAKVGTNFAYKLR
jgi:hypothetical protein